MPGRMSVGLMVIMQKYPDMLHPQLQDSHDKNSPQTTELKMLHVVFLKTL